MNTAIGARTGARRFEQRATRHAPADREERGHDQEVAGQRDPALTGCREGTGENGDQEEGDDRREQGTTDDPGSRTSAIGTATRSQAAWSDT